MIIKGKSRAGPGPLAAHLGNAETNEKVTLVETRGTIADDLRGALIEMDAYAAGTKCVKSLYHAAISPEPPHRLTPEQRMEAIDALEAKLGFVGHARVVMMHEKKDREHIHVVWSRIDLVRGRAVSDSHNYRKHEECARELERRFGHDRVQGALAEREGVERPDRTPSRAELRQEERTGITGKQVKAEVTLAFRSSDNAEAFKAALEDRGYVLAQGDRRDFVVVDRAGGIHSLARRIDGMRAAELRDYMAPIDRSMLLTANEARATQVLLSFETRAATAPPFAQDNDDHVVGKGRGSRTAKDYGRGDDYVSQTSAALKDHQNRHKQLDEQHAEEVQRQKDFAELRKQYSHLGFELTDDKLESLRQFLSSKGTDGRFADRDHPQPDRQPPAPGGGRSRGR